MKISIEIGGYAVRVATQSQGKIEMLDIGDSSSPYTIPSRVIIMHDGNILVGNQVGIDSWTLGKEIFLDDIDYNDIDFEKAYEALIKYINKKVEKQYHTSIVDIVMIVPPSYATNDPRKSKITNVFLSCGIRNISFLTSDITYCHNSVSISYDETALVYNIGYNNTHVSLVKRVGKDLVSIACTEIKGLGGQIFDSLIYQDIESKIDIEYNEKFQLSQVQLIGKLCRIIKEELSQSETFSISIPYSSQQYTIQRETLESMIKDDIESSIKEAFNCIKKSSTPLTDIRKIILTGGSAMIPYIQKIMSLTFNIGNGEKKDIIVPSCSTSAMYDSCKGGLSVQNTGGILNI